MDSSDRRVRQQFAEWFGRGLAREGISERQAGLAIGRRPGWLRRFVRRKRARNELTHAEAVALVRLLGDDPDTVLSALQAGRLAFDGSPRVEAEKARPARGAARAGRSEWRWLARAAIHEAGHAGVAVYLGRRPLLKSMALTGEGGWTELEGEDDLESQSVDLLLDRITIELGGLAAESGMIGSPAASSGHDVASATRIAVHLAWRGLLPGAPPADLEALKTGLDAAPAQAAMRAVLRTLSAAHDEAANAVVANVESVRDLALQLLIAPRRRLDRAGLQEAIEVCGFEPKDRHSSDDDPIEVLRNVGHDFEFAWQAFEAQMRRGEPSDAGG